MVRTSLRRHFKSVFANYSASPGLSPAVKISGIFRHYDAIYQQFTCTLKDDEALYDALQMQMNETYDSEIECNAALRVNLKFNFFNFQLIHSAYLPFFFSKNFQM